MNLPSFFHLAVNNRLWDCFLFGATTNEANVNIHAQVFEWTCALIFLGKVHILLLRILH